MIAIVPPTEETMTATEFETTHRTVRLPHDDIAWRTMRIKAPRDKVEAAWRDSGIPGSPVFQDAPADRGIDLIVELPKKDNDDAEHRLSPYEGGSIEERLESALWSLKARIETGEVATTDGQSSGRKDD